MSQNKRELIQQQALDTAIKHQRCTLAVSMGVGKTKIGLDYLLYFYEQYDLELKALVVAPKLSIFQSWKDDLIKFGYPPDLLKSITFTTYLSLNKQDVNYDIVVLDECHNLLETHLPFLSAFHGRILGLSGTPPRYGNSVKGRLVNTYCPVKFSYITDTAVDDNILNDYKIYVHMISLSVSNDIPVETKKYKFYTSEYNTYQYWVKRVEDAQQGKQKQIASVMRMKAMMNFTSKEFYTQNLLKEIKEKCIVFCNTQDQADRMCRHSYHSGNMDSHDNLMLFKEGTINTLSCVLQLNEGVTIPDLKAGIILHAYGNERKSNQRIGRLLRLNPDDCATVHILCYRNTVDEKWVASALQDLDPEKIQYINAFSNYEHAVL